jgi:hypothetical protein
MPFLSLSASPTPPMGLPNVMQGRINIVWDGSHMGEPAWTGTICDDGWDETDASVACRQLTGGPTASMPYGSPTPVGWFRGASRDAAQPVALTRVKCGGGEMSFGSCNGTWLVDPSNPDVTLQPEAAAGCPPDQDAGVICFQHAGERCPLSLAAGCLHVWYPFGVGT